MAACPSIYLPIPPPIITDTCPLCCKSLPPTGLPPVGPVVPVLVPSYPGGGIYHGGVTAKPDPVVHDPGDPVVRKRVEICNGVTSSGVAPGVKLPLDPNENAPGLALAAALGGTQCT